MNELEQLSLEVALLRVLSRGGLLGSREAFEEVSQLVVAALGCDHLALFLPDGAEHARLYAVERSVQPIVAFGEKIPTSREVWDRVYGEGLPFFRRDTREGPEIERLAAGAGFLSYVQAPLRASPGGRVVADLSVVWRRVGGCDELDLERLEVVLRALGPHLPWALECASHRRVAEIVRRSDDAVLAWDRVGCVTEATPAVERIFGLPLDEVLGAHVSELFEAEEGSEPGAGPARRVARFWVGGLGASPPLLRPLLRRRPHAGLRRVDVRETAVEDDPRVHCHALIRDVSDVELAEMLAAEGFRRARQTEHQHRALLDNAPIIIFRLGEELELRYLNAHAERLLGVSLDRELGARLRDRHVDPEGAEAFDQAAARARAGRMSQAYEARLRREAGEPITLRGTLYPLLADDGRVVAIEGVLVDVSDERDARRKLVQADRLSTLGTLAAGVAHELNNPAAFALIGIDVLDRLVRGPRTPEVDAQVADLIAELRGGVRRIVEIAGDLRTFAAPASGNYRTMVDVNRAVESAVTLTRSKLLERAELDLSLGDVPVVMMEDGRLTQVVVNLVVNATQAIARWSKGRVSITTGERDGWVEVQVIDTGSGVGKENQARIFQPFFTTKAAIEGTGLGLSISREIVERAGGTLSVDSPWPPGGEGGSRFVISLPVGEGAGDARAAPGSSPSSTRLAREQPRRLEVLIVDDEPALARVLELELEAHHDVSIASCAEAALQAIEATRFDVVLCDLLMPGTMGGALRELVRERQPDLAERFVFMTGVGFGRELVELRATGAPVLEKPFALQAVLRELRCAARRHPKEQELP